MEIIPEFDIPFPSWAHWVAYLAMTHWPVGSETTWWGRARSLRAIADQLKASEPDLLRVRAEVAAVFAGDTHDSFDKQYAKLFGGNTSQAKLVDGLEALADTAENLGDQIQLTKLNIIEALAFAVWMLAQLAVTVFFNPAAAAEAPVIEAVTEAAIQKAAEEGAEEVAQSLLRSLARTLVGRLTWLSVARGGLIGAGIGVGQTLLNDDILTLEGHPEGAGTLLKQLEQAIIFMGTAGATGALTGRMVGALLDDVFGQEIGRGMGFLKNALTGLTSAEAANVVATLAGGGNVGGATFVGGLVGLLEAGHGVGGAHGVSVPDGIKGAERVSGVDAGSAVDAPHEPAGQAATVGDAPTTGNGQVAANAPTPPTTEGAPQAAAGDSGGAPSGNGSPGAGDVGARSSEAPAGSASTPADAGKAGPSTATPAETGGSAGVDAAPAGTAPSGAPGAEAPRATPNLSTTSLAPEAVPVRDGPVAYAGVTPPEVPSAPRAATPDLSAPSAASEGGPNSGLASAGKAGVADSGAAAESAAKPAAGVADAAPQARPDAGGGQADGQARAGQADGQAGAGQAAAAEDGRISQPAAQAGRPDPEGQGQLATRADAGNSAQRPEFGRSGDRASAAPDGRDGSRLEAGREDSARGRARPSDGTARPGDDRLGPVARRTEQLEQLRKDAQVNRDVLTRAEAERDEALARAPEDVRHAYQRFADAREGSQDKAAWKQIYDGMLQTDDELARLQKAVESAQGRVVEDNVALVDREARLREAVEQAELRAELKYEARRDDPDVKAAQEQLEQLRDEAQVNRDVLTRAEAERDEALARAPEDVRHAYQRFADAREGSQDKAAWKQIYDGMLQTDDELAGLQRAVETAQERVVADNRAVVDREARLREAVEQAEMRAELKYEARRDDPDVKAAQEQLEQLREDAQVNRDVLTRAEAERDEALARAPEDVRHAYQRFADAREGSQDNAAWKQIFDGMLQTDDDLARLQRAVETAQGRVVADNRAVVDREARLREAVEQAESRAELAKAQGVPAEKPADGSTDEPQPAKNDAVDQARAKAEKSEAAYHSLKARRDAALDGDPKEPADKQLWEYKQELLQARKELAERQARFDAVTSGLDARQKAAVEAGRWEELPGRRARGFKDEASQAASDLKAKRADVADKESRFKDHPLQRDVRVAGERAIDDREALERAQRAAEPQRMSTQEAKLRQDLAEEFKTDPRVQPAWERLDQAKKQAQESQQAAFMSMMADQYPELADHLKEQMKEQVLAKDNQLQADKEELDGAREELAAAQARFDAATSGLDDGQKAAIEAGRWQELHGRIDPVLESEAAAAAAELEAKRADVALKESRYNDELDFAVQQHASNLATRHDAVMKVLEGAQGDYEAARKPLVDERYAALQAERQKVFDEADARTARVRAEAAESRREAKAQTEKAEAALEESQGALDHQNTKLEAAKKGNLDDSIKVARERLETVRKELNESRQAHADELREARENEVEPRRDVLDSLDREIDHRTKQVRRKAATYEALLRASGDHQAELEEAEAQRDRDGVVSSRREKRAFSSEVAKQEAKWRDVLAGHEQAARSELLEEAEQRVKQDEAALEAAKANEKDVKWERFKKLQAEEKVAGEEYWRAYNDGLLDARTANERFGEQRGPVGTERALAREEAWKTLDLVNKTEPELKELMWSGDELLRQVAVDELASRSLDNEGAHAFWTQLQLAGAVTTEAAGRQVSADMKCGEGKSLSGDIWAIDQAIAAAQDPELGPPRLTTSRSHLAAKMRTEFGKIFTDGNGKPFDFGIDVHYIDNADKPWPKPRPDRGTIYIVDSHTESFADLKGNSAPHGPALDDEGDEKWLHSGGGIRVGEQFQLSEGAAQEARPEVAAPSNSGAKFLEENVRSEQNPDGKLTPEHFGVGSRWGYGTVDVSPEHRAEIEKVLTEWANEHGRHDFGFDDVEKAAIAEYQYRRNIDYVVAVVDMDGHPQKLILLIDRVNGEVRFDPETHNDVRVSNGIHRALEAKENLVEEEAGRPGLKIRHDVDAPKKMTSQEYYLKRIELGDKISTISGTNIESSELMAENYEKLGPTIAIDRFNTSDVDFDPDLMFDTQEDKQAWMAQEIKRLQEKGQRVLVGADRNDKPAELSKLLKEMGVPHRVIGDADYQIKYSVDGAKWQDRMVVDIKEALENNEAILGGPSLGRGVDFRVPAEAMDLGGIYLLADGRSGITDVVDAQLQNRVGRNGDPGRYRFVLSRDDDVFTQIQDPRIQNTITHYEGAAKAHADAQADPSQWKAVDLDTLKQARDAAANRLLKLIPKIQQDAQQHLFTPHTFGAHPAPAAHTPPATAPSEGQLKLSSGTTGATTTTDGTTGTGATTGTLTAAPPVDPSSGGTPLVPAAAGGGTPTGGTTATGPQGDTTSTVGTTDTPPATALSEGKLAPALSTQATPGGTTATDGTTTTGGATGTGEATGAGDTAGTADTTGAGEPTGTDDTTGTTPDGTPPSTVGDSTTTPDAAEWLSTPLVGAGSALALAQSLFPRTSIVVPQTKTVTAAQFANHLRGPAGSHAKPADAAWDDNPNIGGLFAGLRDGTTELVFLATGPSESQQQGRVWVLTAKTKNGQVFVEASTDAGADALAVHECSSEVDLVDFIDLDAPLRALALDRDGHVQPASAHGPIHARGHPPQSGPSDSVLPGGASATVQPGRARTSRDEEGLQSQRAVESGGEVSSAARQWGERLAWQLVGAVESGRRSGEAAAVADRAAGVDVMDVAAVAEKVWRATQDPNGDGVVAVRLVVNVDGAFVELVGEAQQTLDELRLTVVARPAGRELAEQAQRAGAVVSVAQLVDGLTRSWAGYGNSRVALEHSRFHDAQRQLDIEGYWEGGCVIGVDLSQAAVGLNKVARALVEAEAALADPARAPEAAQKVGAAVQTAIEQRIFDSANAGRIEAMGRGLRSPSRELLDLIGARVAVLRQALAGEALRTTDQLHTLKSGGGRRGVGVHSLKDPVILGGLSELDGYAEVVQRFLDDVPDGDAQRARVDEALQRWHADGASDRDRDAAAAVLAGVMNWVAEQILSRLSGIVQVTDSVVQWLVDTSVSVTPELGATPTPAPPEAAAASGVESTAAEADSDAHHTGREQAAAEPVARNGGPVAGRSIITGPDIGAWPDGAPAQDATPDALTPDGGTTDMPREPEPAEYVEGWCLQNSAEAISRFYASRRAGRSPAVTRVRAPPGREGLETALMSLAANGHRKWRGTGPDGLQNVARLVNAPIEGFRSADGNGMWVLESPRRIRDGRRVPGHAYFVYCRIDAQGRVSLRKIDPTPDGVVDVAFDPAAVAADVDIHGILMYPNGIPVEQLYDWRPEFDAEGNWTNFHEVELLAYTPGVPQNIAQAHQPADLAAGRSDDQLSAPEHRWAAPLEVDAVDRDGRPVTHREYPLDEYIRMVEEKEGRAVGPERRETLRRRGCVGVVLERIGHTDDMPAMRSAFGDVQSHGEIANLERVLAPVEAANRVVAERQLDLTEAEDAVRKREMAPGFRGWDNEIQLSALEHLERCQRNLAEARKHADRTLAHVSRSHNVEEMMAAKNEAKVEGNRRTFVKVLAYANELNKIFAAGPADAGEVVHLVQAHPGLGSLHDIGPSLPSGNPGDWEAVIIYKDLWSGQTETPDHTRQIRNTDDTWVGKEFPDPARFAPDPQSGRVDMSKDLHQGRPNCMRFNYAWYDPETESWWGSERAATNSEIPMRVKQMTDEHLFASRVDYDTSVFSIQIVNRSSGPTGGEREAGGGMGGPARVVRVSQVSDLPVALAAVRRDGPRPSVVVAGGVGGLDGAGMQRLRVLFADAIVPVMAERNAVGVGGGLAAGVGALLGAARTARGASLPLVGVVAAGRVQVGGQSPVGVDAVLEPHHTHFVVLPANRRGAEAEWVARSAKFLAGGAPSVTVLVGGDPAAYADVDHSIKAGRPVVVIKGSGGIADVIAAALDDGAGGDERAAALAATGMVRGVSVDDPAALAGVLAEVLLSPEGSAEAGAYRPAAGVPRETIGDLVGRAAAGDGEAEARLRAIYRDGVAEVVGALFIDSDVVVGALVETIFAQAFAALAGADVTEDPVRFFGMCLARAASSRPVLGKWLQAQRLSRNWSQVVLSRRADLHHSTVNEAERGRLELAKRTLGWLVAALGLWGPKARKVLDHFRPLPVVKPLTEYDNEYGKEKKANNGFGQWLRTMRGSLELTQDDLAELSGAGDVTELELGLIRPSRDMARWLVSAVGLWGEALRKVVDYFVPLPAVKVLIEDEEVLTRVGKVLRDKRLARGLTHDTVAELVGLSSSSISHVQQGDMRPSVEVAVRWIETVLGSTVGEVREAVLPAMAEQVYPDVRGRAVELVTKVRTWRDEHSGTPLTDVPNEVAAEALGLSTQQVEFARGVTGQVSAQALRGSDVMAFVRAALAGLSPQQIDVICDRVFLKQPLAETAHRLGIDDEETAGALVDSAQERLRAALGPPRSSDIDRPTPTAMRPVHELTAYQGERRKLGVWVRENRQARGWSLDELANWAGLSKSLVGMLERDVRTPSWDTAAQLVSALLGVSGEASQDELLEVLDYFVAEPEVRVLIEHPELKKLFGRLVREKRLEHGWQHQRDLASRVRLDDKPARDRNVNDVELGRSVSAKLAVAVLEALGYTVDEFRQLMLRVQLENRYPDLRRRAVELVTAVRTWRTDGALPAGRRWSDKQVEFADRVIAGGKPVVEHAFSDRDLMDFVRAALADLPAEAKQIEALLNYLAVGQQWQAVEDVAQRRLGTTAARARELVEAAEQRLREAFGSSGSDGPVFVLGDCVAQAISLAGAHGLSPGVLRSEGGRTSWRVLREALGLVLTPLTVSGEVESVVDGALQASAEEQQQRSLSVMVFDIGEPDDHAVVFVDLDEHRLVFDPRNRELLRTAFETVENARRDGRENDAEIAPVVAVVDRLRAEGYDFSLRAAQAEGRTAMSLPYPEWLVVQDYANIEHAWVGHLGFQRINDDQLPEADPDTQPDKPICTTEEPEPAAEGGAGERQPANELEYAIRRFEDAQREIDDLKDELTDRLSRLPINIDVARAVSSLENLMDVLEGDEVRQEFTALVGQYLIAVDRKEIYEQRRRDLRAEAATGVAIGELEAKSEGARDLVSQQRAGLELTLAILAQVEPAVGLQIELTSVRSLVPRLLETIVGLFWRGGQDRELARRLVKAHVRFEAAQQQAYWAQLALDEARRDHESSSDALEFMATAQAGLAEWLSGLSINVGVGEPVSTPQQLLDELARDEVRDAARNLMLDRPAEYVRVAELLADYLMALDRANVYARREEVLAAREPAATRQSVQRLVSEKETALKSRLDEALARILSELPEEVETIQEMPLMLRLPRLGAGNLFWENRELAQKAIKAHVELEAARQRLRWLNQTPRHQTPEHLDAQSTDGEHAAAADDRSRPSLDQQLDRLKHLVLTLRGGGATLLWSGC